MKIVLVKNNILSSIKSIFQIQYISSKDTYLSTMFPAKDDVFIS